MRNKTSLVKHAQSFLQSMMAGIDHVALDLPTIEEKVNVAFSVAEAFLHKADTIPDPPPATPAVSGS